MSRFLFICYSFISSLTLLRLAQSASFCHLKEGQCHGHVMGYNSSLTFPKVPLTWVQFGGTDFAVVNDGETGYGFYHVQLDGENLIMTFNMSLLINFTAVSQKSPHFVDLDGDDDTDFVFFEELNDRYGFIQRLRYFVNDDDVFVESNFTKPYPLNGHIINTDWANTITVADVDADNDMDIVVGMVHGTLILYRNINASNLTFVEEPLSPFTNIDVGFYASPAMTDLDGDGDLDLMIINQGGNLFFFENTGNKWNPIFTERSTNFLSESLNGHSASYFIDLNGDKTPDLYNDNKLFISSRFKSTNYQEISNINIINEATFADLNGDGNLEIISMNQNTVVYENQGTSGEYLFGVKNYSTLSDIDFNGPIAFADLNGDNRPDLVVAGNSNIQYYRNIGTAQVPNFNVSPLVLFSGSYVSISFGDIDNDGDVDMVVGKEPDYNDNNYDIFYTSSVNIGNKTHPSFSSTEWLTTGVDPTPGYTGIGMYPRLSLVDEDSDGDMDLYFAISFAASCEIQYYENTGSRQSPTFTKRETHPFSSYAYAHGCRIDVRGNMAMISADYDTPVRLYDSSICTQTTPCSGSTSNCLDASKCECPSGRNGTTCETCANAYYEDFTTGTVSATPRFATCVQCPKGKWSNTPAKPFFAADPPSTCTNCPVGTYGTDQGQSSLGTACESCPPGRYSNLIGNPSFSGCKICSAGKFSAARSTTCTTCALGTTSIEGALRCTPCQPGSFGNASGFCISCLINTYADVEGLTACKNCPTGQVSLEGAVTCIDEIYGLAFQWPPSGQSITEGGVINYQVALKTTPSSPVNVALEVSGNCQVTPSTFVNTATVMVQTTVRPTVSHLNTEAYTCTVKHVITTSDPDYQSALHLAPTISVLAKGCGQGEFLGAYDRKYNGTQCVCQQNYFLPPKSDCVICPTDKSECKKIGLHAPLVSKNWWRDDPTSSDINTQPFYRCPFPNACSGGNSTVGRCATGYDDNGVLCASCKAEYALQGTRCVPCPGRKSAGDFSGELLVVCFAGLIAFALATFLFLTHPALTKKDKAELRRLLRSSNVSFDDSGFMKKDSFVKIDTNLSDIQMKQAFDVMDTDHDGKISRNDWDAFMKETKHGMPDTKVRNVAMQTVKDIHEIIEKRGSPSVKALWGKVSRALLEFESFLKELQLALKAMRDAIRGSFTGDLAWLIEGMMKPIDDLEAKIRKLERAFQELMASLLEHLNDARGMMKILVPFFSMSFDTLQLSFDVVLPNITLDIASRSLDLSAILKNINIIMLDLKNLIPDMSNIKGIFNRVHMWLPSFSLVNPFDMGGWLMKLKIFVGFAQCFAYFPVTFDIPWPQSLLGFMKAMEFTAFDLYAVFGDVSCRMQTGFLQKFVYHMLLFPAVLAVIFGVYVIARTVKGITQMCHLTKFTNESLKTQVLTLVSLVSFTLYTGISTRIFRLYKCRKVQDTWYLTADYTVKCQQGEWNGYAAFGAICILFFVIGIPGVQLYILYKNRLLLHVRDGMTHKEKQQQHIVQKEYGSIYEHYTEECYYYDILDLFRRLLLTGGLIMMGEESVAQVFLGIVICAMWLTLVVHKKPYKSGWDNFIAIILAAHLLFTLVSGMALKLYASTPDQDAYQRAGFGIVLVFVSVVCVLLGVCSIIASTPCLRDTVMRRLNGVVKSGGKKIMPMKKEVEMVES